MYHIGADDIGLAALAAVTFIAPFEASILDTTATVFKVLTSDPASVDFIVDALAIAGTSVGGGSLLPLFNTLRALVRVDSFGRNDSKFYRGYLDESFTEDGLIAGATVTGVAGLLNTLMSDMSGNGTPLLADDSAAWLLATVQQEIQMRQLHRKRRRSLP